MSTRTSHRILLVDGNAELRRATADALRRRGWDVRDVSDDVRVAIDAAQLHQPHVIITELELAGVTGMHFGRSLRSVVEHDVRLIAGTSAPSSLHEQARQAGFDAVFAKPLDLDAVHRDALDSTPPNPADDYMATKPWIARLDLSMP